MTCKHIELNVRYCVPFRVRVRISVRIRFSVVVGKLLCTRICATLGCNCHGPPLRPQPLVAYLLIKLTCLPGCAHVGQ